MYFPKHWFFTTLVENTVINMKLVGTKNELSRVLAPGFRQISSSPGQAISSLIHHAPREILIKNDRGNRSLISHVFRCLW